MYGDFSRVLDAPSGRFSAVLAQQGRFLLDAELNEQTSIILDHLRRLTTDLIGPFAGPLHHCGFRVESLPEHEDRLSVRLSPGHYYVYGLRCEAPTDADPIPIGDHDPPFVVYLLVWEQTVGAIQAPGLVEPALGADAPDTTRRTQVRWRPRATRSLLGFADLTELDRNEIAEAFHEYNSDQSHRPRLGARVRAGSTPESGPATAPAPSGYSGVENQLYRVEVHHGGDTEQATFKWSRDNGSVEFGLAALSAIDQAGLRTAKLRTVWRDSHRGLEVGDWVELVDDRWSPIGLPAPLMRVNGIALAKREVTLEDTHADRPFDLDEHPLLRRWDHRPEGSTAKQGIPTEETGGKWFDLEDGVQVLFEHAEAHYQRGDYWLIPARTATGGVLWPTSSGDPLALPPHGPARYLAPLELVTSSEGVNVDLRTRFSHLVGEPPEDDTVAHPTFKPNISAQPEPPTISHQAVSYRLRSLSTESPGVVFDVYDGLTLGRSADCGVCFDLTEVSRHHAMFSVTPDGVTIVDLGSSNGTRVNNEPLSPRVQTPLSPGDTIQIGTDAVQLQVEES